MTTDVSTNHRRDSWMQTFTGRKFFPFAPRPEDVDVRDIAHGLALQCRYNGQCRSFYSVAEHCVVMSRLVSPEHALWALLHDATEAYVGDLISPVKIHLPDYREIEDRIMLAITQRFGLDPEMPAEVHEVDRRILLDERSALFDAPAGDWRVPGEPFGVLIPCWSPDQAEEEYLTRLAELTLEKEPMPTTICPTSGDNLDDGWCPTHQWDCGDFHEFINQVQVGT